jgi:TonB family protein
MNKGLTISFLSHAVLLTLVITVSFSHSNLMKNIYVVNLVSLPSPPNQSIPLLKEETISPVTNLKQTSQPNKINTTTGQTFVKKSFSSENYMQSIEKKLAEIEKAFKNKKNQNVSPKKLIFSSTSSNKFSKTVVPAVPFGQQINSGYFSQIKNIIQQHWLIPQGNMYSNPSVISFRLWNDGTISDIILQTGSGSQRFDNSAIEAIKSVGKFPQFPGSMNERYVDITITFTEGGIE